MQQLRERAGKIVQHLTVEEVTSEQGVQLIKQEMEKSPIIRLLDNKKIDKRRQKFMKLTRLANESIESFINRAEIYRRENEASPAYRVGSCFYVGHLLDSAKLTRKDLALLKAACGGDVEDETKVISAMLELAVNNLKEHHTAQLVVVNLNWTMRISISYKNPAPALLLRLHHRSLLQHAVGSFHGAGVAVVFLGVAFEML